MAQVKNETSRNKHLEKKLTALNQRNSSLSQQLNDSHRENLKLARLIDHLKRKLKTVQICDSPTERRRKGRADTGFDDLFFTFPEELWPYMLSYITDSNDRLSLCAASPLLDTVILNKDKPVWLFYQIYHHIFKWLPTNDVLTCRMVCKTWNQAVENHLDSSSTKTLPIWYSKLPPTDFDNTSDLSRCIIAAESHSSRRILIHRSVKLGLNLDIEEDDNEVNEFWETATTLLHSIGSHLWHVEFYNDGYETEPVAFYGLIHQLLCLLPNLKTLRLICEFENIWPHQDEELLARRLGTWPIPSLPFLECLHLVHSIPDLISSSVMACLGGQLQVLVISVAILIHVGEEYLRGFFNLKKLVLRDCVKNEDEFGQVLKKLEKLEAPHLERLRLFRSYTELEVVEVTYLFRLVVEKFPKLRSLDTYRMKMIGSLDSGAGDGLPVGCSQITTLKIRDTTSTLSSFDFLLKLPALENLYVREDYEVIMPPEPEETVSKSLIDIKYCLLLGNMYESNVWELVPSLKKVVYDGWYQTQGPSGCFTREMYDYLKKVKKTN